MIILEYTDRDRDAPKNKQHTQYPKIKQFINDYHTKQFPAYSSFTPPEFRKWFNNTFEQKKILKKSLLPISLNAKSLQKNNL